MIRKIIWSIVFLAIAATYSDASIGGNSETLNWLTISVVSIVIIYFLMVAISIAINKFRKIELTERSTIHDDLTTIEPYLSIIFRLLVLVMLCTMIDKVDKLTWGVANQELATLQQMKESIDDIKQSLDSTKDSVESIEAQQ